MSDAREFKVTPPDMRVPALVIGFTVLVCAGSLFFLMRDVHGPMLVWIVALCALAPVIVLIAVMRRRVSFDGETLRIVAGLNQTRVAKAQLKLDEARIVQLDASPETRIGIKTLGTAMPGYYAGHFRQIGGSRVFALVTDKRRVLVIPERDGRLLMLSLERPQALLDALGGGHR